MKIAPDHHGGDSEGGDASQQSDNQPQRTKELGADDQKRHWSRESHVLKPPMVA
jgi:hypothetical protein